MMKMFKRILVVLLAVCLCLNSSVIISAASKTVTVATQAQLEKVIKSGKATMLKISTKKAVNFTIPASSKARKMKLVVNAPKAKLTNKAQFKSITLEGKAVKFVENGKNNSITINADTTSFKVSNKTTVKRLVLKGDKANLTVNRGSKIETLISKNKDGVLNLCVNGKVGKFTVASEDTSVNVSGTGDIPTIVTDKVTEQVVVGTKGKAEFGVDFFTANSIDVWDLFGDGDPASFTFKTTTVNGDEVEVPATVSKITWVTDDTDAGYAKTTVDIHFDFPTADETNWFVSAYDGYTGTCLESGWTEYTPEDGSYSHTDVCVVNVDGVDIDVSMTINVENRGQDVYLQIVHPLEYYGTVIQIGGSTEENVAIGKSIDYSKKFKATDYNICYDPYYFN